MGDPTIRSVHTVGTIRQHNLVMAGITTSETMAGEQPKDDNFGSRVDELERISVGLEPILKDFLRRIEALEEKNSDEEQL